MFVENMLLEVPVRSLQCHAPRMTSFMTIIHVQLTVFHHTLGPLIQIASSSGLKVGGRRVNELAGQLAQLPSSDRAETSPHRPRIARPNRAPRGREPRARAQGSEATLHHVPGGVAGLRRCTLGANRWALTIGCQVGMLFVRA